MPKYKLSPEERAAKKERREQVKTLMSNLDVKDLKNINSLYKEMIGAVLDKCLEAELDDELGYTKYDYHNKPTENSRNGYSRKTMKTSFGDIEINIPRDVKANLSHSL